MKPIAVFAALLLLSSSLHADPFAITNISVTDTARLYWAAAFPFTPHGVYCPRYIRGTFLPRIGLCDHESADCTTLLTCLPEYIIHDRDGLYGRAIEIENRRFLDDLPSIFYFLGLTLGGMTLGGRTCPP